MDRLSVFSQNIKSLRRALGLTQEGFALKIDASKAMVGQYELAKNLARPAILANILAIVGITEQDFTSKVLSFSIQGDKIITTHEGKLLSGFAQPTDGKNQQSDEKTRDTTAAPVHSRSNATALDVTMNVPLVSQYAYAGYLNGFGDETYMEELPTVPFSVERQAKGNYMAFEVKGDSMESTGKHSYYEGDVVLGREIRQHLWKSPLHIKKWRFVIVHRTEGILLKEISKHNVDKGIITLHSLNEAYEDFDVSLNDVAQIFNVIKKQSNE